ncbi:MAG: ribonuclease P protein component, partial [Deltaproteobacteria bacterium]
MSDIAQKIDTRFRKAEKVRVKAEFDNIYKNGKRFYSTNFVVIILKNHLEIRRVGIVVTKKTGKAFRRNRIKRILREFF